MAGMRMWRPKHQLWTPKSLLFKIVYEKIYFLNIGCLRIKKFKFEHKTFFPGEFFFSNFRIEINSAQKFFTTLSSYIITDFSPKKSDQILLLRFIQILLKKITTILYFYEMLRKKIKKLLSPTFCLQICSSLSSPLLHPSRSCHHSFLSLPFPSPSLL